MKRQTIVAILLFVTPITGKAQTFAPLVANPFNLSGLGGMAELELVDLDADGDLDLVTGTDYGNWGASLNYFENTGTPTAPNFAPGIPEAFGSTYIGGILSPTFVDMDNDGDFDMVVGNQSGFSNYYENIGTATNFAFAAPVTADPFNLYDVGYLSSHTFSDLDNDGDQDALIGEYYGGMYYFENIGTASAPNFGAMQLFPFGLSGVGLRPKPAFQDIDGDGDFDLMVGMENGNHVYFQNTGTVSAPVFASPVINPFGVTATPNVYASPAFGDLDFDGDIDMMSTDNSNNFNFFENTSPVPIPPAPTTLLTPDNLYTCYGTSAFLTAVGVPTGTIGWYDAPAGGNWLGGGPYLLTGPITAPTTLFIQDSTNGGPSPSRTPITITVTPSASLHAVSASPSSICESGSVVIQTLSSEAGVNYSLYDVATGTYVGAPVTGDGGPLIFNTLTITATQNFEIVAESTHTQGAMTRVCMQPVDEAKTIEVKQPIEHQQTIPVCLGENYTYADGTTVNAVMTSESHATIYTGMGSNGCDSIFIENLIALPAAAGSVTTTICYEESITVNGTVYDAANPTGTEVLPNAAANGCDSIVTINLSFFPYVEHVLTTAICPDESILVNGTVYDASHLIGLETFPNATANGCDSMVVVNLTLLPVLESTMTATICAEESITINGTVYNGANPTGTEVFTGVNGCDSTVTINLTVLPALSSTYSPIVCYYDSIVFNGTTYNLMNMFGTEVFTGANGCDSVVTVSLLIPAINPFTTTNGTTITALPGYTYQWIDCSTNQPIDGATSQSFTATSNGNYAVILNQEGCLDTTPCIAITTVGLEESNKSLLSVYPNPTETNIHISGLETLNGVQSVSIMDLNGKHIYTMYPIDSTCDVSALEPGMYYLNVIHENGTEIIRFTKK